MTHLAKLTLSDKQRVDVKPTVEERLRAKLVDRLAEQKELAEADLKGEQLTKTRVRFVKDNSTGETTRIEVPKQIRRWWWKDETGAVMLIVRYGNKPVLIMKDKSTIEVGTLDSLPKVIDTLVEAVKAGELDKALKAAVERRRQK